MNGTVKIWLDLQDVSDEIYRLVSYSDSYALARSKDARPLIDDLLLIYRPDQLGALLGIKETAIMRQHHPSTVARAALMLHLLTFSNGGKVTVFDILTGCRYKLPSSCGIRSAKDQPENVTFNPVSA